MYNPDVAASHSQLVSIIDQWQQCTNELVKNCGPAAPPQSSIRQSTKHTIKSPHNRQGPKKRLDSRISPGSPTTNVELDTDQSLNVVRLQMSNLFSPSKDTTDAIKPVIPKKHHRGQKTKKRGKAQYKR